MDGISSLADQKSTRTLELAIFTYVTVATVQHNCYPREEERGDAGADPIGHFSIRFTDFHGRCVA